MLGERKGLHSGIGTLNVKHDDISALFWVWICSTWAIMDLDG